VTVNELARRFCAATHPFLPSSTGKLLPCGPHQMMAQRLLYLTTEDADKVWAVLATAREEAGLEAPERRHTLAEVMRMEAHEEAVEA
jgi:hypothetical protein